MDVRYLGLLLSLIAGLSTTIGSLIVFFLKDFKVLPFAVCMAVSAGVMMYVSMVEMFSVSQQDFLRGLHRRDFAERDAEKWAYCLATLSFFSGWLLTTLFDKVVHAFIHIVEIKGVRSRSALPAESEFQEVAASASANNLEAEVLDGFQTTVLTFPKTNRYLMQQNSFSKESAELHGAKVLPNVFPLSELPAIALSGSSTNIATKDCLTPSTIAEIRHNSLSNDSQRNEGVAQSQSARDVLDEGVTRKNGKNSPMGVQQIGVLSFAAAVAEDSLTPSAKRMSVMMDAHLEAQQSQISHLRQWEGANAVRSCWEGANAVRSCCSTADSDKKECTFKKLFRSETTESDKMAVAMAELQFQKNNASFTQMGLFTAVALAIHNFPEGVATYTGTLANPTFGVGIAVAVGIHNIPEGFAVAVPIYFGTGSKWKGFWFSFLSGFAEPIGALIAFLAIGNDYDPLVFGALFGLIGGIMTNIALKELYPASLKYDPTDKAVTSSFFLAMMVMGASLVGMQFATV